MNKNKTILGLFVFFICLTMLSMPVLASGSHPTLGTGVVGSWSFEETSGHIQDSSGNNHHSTSILGTPLYSQTGLISDSISFDGSQVFSIAHHNDLNFGTGDFTANVWLAPSEQGTILRAMGKYSSNYGVGWVIQRLSNNKWLIGIRQTSSNNHYITGTSTTGLNKWQMVTLVREGDTLRIYVDGELENIKVDSTIQDVNVNTDVSLRFGARDENEAYKFKGKIDEGIVYNRALSSSEIEEIYLAQFEGRTEGQYPYFGYTPDIEYSNFEVTSTNVVSGATNWNTDDIVTINSNELTFTFNTDRDVSCSAVLNNELNYTDAITLNPLYGFSDPAVSTHEFTIIDDISAGSHCLYVSCTDGTVTTDTGCLQLVRTHPTLGTGVVGSWSFEETSGHIQDSSGNNHHSTSILGTPLYSQTGLISDSISLSGSQVFRIAHHNDFNFGTGDFTANVWLAPSEQGTVLRVMGKDNFVSGSHYVGWYILRHNDNRWGIGIRQLSNVHYIRGTSTTALNKWQMVTLVREGATLRIYVDGELENTKVDSTIQDVNVNTDTSLRFGTTSDSEHSKFKGKIDEGIVYNRALSSLEIKDLYLSQFQGRTEGQYPDFEVQNMGDIINEGLVSAWKFDETSGVSFADSHGVHTITATNEAVSGTDGKINKGATFVGTTHYATSTTLDSVINSWGSNQPFSINLWINPSSTQVQYARILSGYEAGSTEGGFSIEMDGTDNSNNYGFGVHSGTWENPTKFHITPNKWSMVTLSYDGTHKRTYINGVLMETVARGFVTNDVKFILGRWKHDTAGREWNGLLDELKIHDRALSSHEIKHLYLAQAPDKAVEKTYDRQYPNYEIDWAETLKHDMISYYKLDETSGVSFADSHGSNTGTLFNTPSWVTGQINNGLQFTSTSSQYASVGGAGSTLDFTDKSTYGISFWAKANSLSTDSVLISGGGTSGNRYPDLWFQTDGSMLHRGHDSHEGINAPAGTITVGEWYHIVMTGQGKQTKLYVNGEQISVWEHGSINNSFYHTLNFGRRGDGSTYSDVIMDEIAIFKRPITQEEISMFYEIQKDGFETGQYDFSEAFIKDIEYSNFEVTSTNVVSGATNWNTDDIVTINSNELTFTFNTDRDVSCSAVLNNELSYTDAITLNPLYGFSDPAVSTHEFTIIDDISAGSHCLYVSCTDGTETTDTGCLQIEAESSLTVNYINITNARPIWNDKTLNGRFNVADGYDNGINASITWWQRNQNEEVCEWVSYPCNEEICTFSMIYVCELGEWEQHTTNDESWTNVIQNTDYDTTNGVGRVPFTETNNWAEWLMQLTITDGHGTLVVNSSVITIENELPNITYSGSNTDNDNPKNIGEDVTFTFTGTDNQGDTVYLKVCSNPNPEWDDCNLLCQNLVGVPFSTSVPTSISCDYTLSGYTTREQIAYSVVYDGDYARDNNLTYYVNQFPTLTSFEVRNIDNSHILYFGETVNHIRILQDDTWDNSTLDVYVTVRDSDGVLKVDNELMTKTTIDEVEYDLYTSNIFLDAIGNWNVTFTTTDSDGATTTVTKLFEVLVRTITTNGRIYGYDFETFPTYSEYEETLDTFGYYLGEIRISRTTNWNDVSTFIQQAKNDSKVISLTIYDDLSDLSATLNYLDNFNVLTNANHLLAMRNIKLYIADSVTENEENSEKINQITKKIFQQINNRYPIHIRNYNHTDINTNYARIDTQDYITVTTGTEFINREMQIFNEKNDKTRIYYGLTTEFKAKAMNWQSLIIDKMRSTINLDSTLTNPLIIELNNGDLIIANNDTTTQNISFEPTAELIGFDLYNLNTKKIEVKNITGTINIEVAPETAYIIYKTKLSRVQVLEDGRMFVHSEDSAVMPYTIDYMGGSDSYAFNLLASLTSYKENGRIFLRDPSYKYADFMTYYGWGGSEYIADWSNYKYVIVASINTPEWVEEVAGVTETYGYIHIVDYSTLNCLGSTGECYMDNGCTDSWGRGDGSPCDTWNRSVWMNDKIGDIDDWTAISEDVHIFIDGLDYGVVSDDGLFGDALTNLTEYAKITKDRKTILNTYTSYADYSNLADMVMRESACSRWDGIISEPTYEYENITLDIERANFHKAHGQPILLQSFGAKNDTERAYYCYMQNKVLYGDLGYYSYNQPDFWNFIPSNTDKLQWNYQLYPELGASLEADYSVDGDIFTRRFENGIVSVNVAERTVDFIRDETAIEMQLCGYFQDNGEGSPNNEGYVNFRVNSDPTQTFRVYDNDLVHGVKTEKCVNIPMEYYTETGLYEIEFWYIDSDGNLIGNGGLFMFNSIKEEDGVSFYENTETGLHPPSSKHLYQNYPNKRNWDLNFTVETISQGSPFDQVDSIITRTETGDEELTVRFSSSKHWNIPIEDRVVFMNKTLFNGIKVGDIYLNYSENEDCIGTVPTYEETIISGETWKACYYNPNPAEQGYYVRVVIPHLSEQEYTIDGNTPPEITESTIELLDLTNHNQTWVFNFNHTDPDGNEVITCNVLSNDQTFTTLPIGNTCEVEITVPLNETQLYAYLFVEDEYNKSSENGANYTLATIIYDTIASSELVGNLETQHFLKYWNINQPNGDFTNISWNYEGLDTRIINITNTTTNEYLRYSTNVISYGDLEFVPASGSQYTVNSGETVYRFFNVTGNLTTGEEVPSFQITLPQPQYTSGLQEVRKQCEVFNLHSNYTTGTNLTTTIDPQTDSTSECYYYLYQGKIIYSDSTLNYTDDGGIRTYFFTNSLGNNYGRRIQFMFDELKIETTKISDIIPYSSLTNWNNRISGTQQVHRFVSPLTFTQETTGVHYTYQDVVASEIVRFDWNALVTPIDALYINLSWTYTAPSDPPPSGGGGGGGGGGSSPAPTPPTSTQVDLTKVLCDISVVPSRVIITDNNPIFELTIMNRESVSYTPDYEFRDVVGQSSILRNVQLTNEVGTVLANQQKKFGVKYQGGIFGSTALSGGGELVLSSTRCRDIVVPIEMNITATNPIAELISGEEPLLERTTKFLNEPIVEQVNWSKMWLLIGLLSLLFGVILWDKRWSENEFTNWVVKGIAWLFLIALATGLINLIIKTILGG